MYSLQWHQQCESPSSPAPQPLSASQLSTLTPEEQRTYALEVRALVQGRTIWTSHLDLVTDNLTSAERWNRQRGSGAKTIAALSGENGVGKSTIVRQWAREKYLEWTATLTPRSREGLPVITSSDDNDANFVPIVWVNLYSAAQIKDLNAQLLNFFGLPEDGNKVVKDASPIRNQTYRVTRACQRHHTRLVIIDDIHLLKASEKQGRQVLDHVKHLNTELGDLGITMVLVGANLEHGELYADPQISARLDAQNLGPMPFRTKREVIQWQEILADKEEELRDYLPAIHFGILHIELGTYLWARTQGYLGDLSTLIAGATYQAILDNSLTLSKEHFETVRLSSRAETYFAKTADKAKR